MAGLEQSAHALHAVAATSSLERSISSPKRPLPNGACNYRDQALGACGCTQFWDKYSADLHEGSIDHRPTNERSTWCVCSHHACFHLHDDRQAVERQNAGVPAHTRRVVNCDGRCQLQPGSQCSIHAGARTTRPGERLPSVQESQARYNRRLTASLRAGSEQQAGCGASPPTGAALNVASMEPLSQSGLPRIPSVCLLSNERRMRAEEDGRQVRGEVAHTNQHVAGLGFSFDKTHARQASASSTVVSEFNKVPHGSFDQQERTSPRANFMRASSDYVTSPPRGGPMTQIWEFNRTLQLNVEGDTIPNTYNPDDFIQSATEVATPSNQHTPDLGHVDQAVLETKKLVDTLTRLTSRTEGHSGQEQRPPSATSAPAAPYLSTTSSTTLHDQLQQATTAGSPQALQTLVSYLNPLHNLLNSMPNLASTVRDLNIRLDQLENNSFNHVQPEDIQQQFELFDGRLIDLEHRMDDHDAVHKAIDANESDSSGSRRAVGDATESFNSCQSNSSALAHAPMAREDMETEFESIKERLDVLEAAAMPSVANPWEVEVVMLPWGPELRGIWFSADEPMHSKPFTQESEEWTQSLHMAQRARSSSANPVPSGPRSTGSLSLTSSFALSESESGWSSQAIGNWVAGDVDEWLFPKACGSNNMVYKRLQSRGFVRNVTLQGSSAKDIQTTLSKAFGDLSDQLKFTEGDNSPDIDTFPGLRASFIPLRKVLKESRLRFLTHAEMASSALWSAQFLSSGVIMRVSGGKRRLYVTQREAYLQDNCKDEQLAAGEMPRQGGSWTWQEIRELPRFEPEVDSPMEGNDEHCQSKVPEGDAKEPCWTFVEAYDLPPAVSATSSFNSNYSAPVELSMRPAGRQWRRSITPSSILKNRLPRPLSPLSEGQSLRPGYRGRTVSASVLEQAPPSSAKRRYNESPVKPSSSSSSSRRNADTPSRQKRRRVRAPSSCPRVDVEPVSLGQEGQVVLYNTTTRRSRDALPSPFSSSNPGLVRTNSDAASRSQRSAAVVGKTAPFAYATPYSEPAAAYGGFDDFAAGGDTEPDSDYLEDDGEQSWRGVDDEDEGGQGDDEAANATNEVKRYVESSRSSSSSGSSEEEGSHINQPGRFSGEDSGSDSDDDEGDAGEDSDYAFGYQRSGTHHHDDGDDGDEVFDTLLGVLHDGDDIDDIEGLKRECENKWF